MTAVDLDSGINAEITYSIEPATDSTIVYSCCDVDSNSGEVRLIASLAPGDVNATYVVTVRATDAGTQPLSTSARLCVTVVDRNVSEDHLRSAARGWLTSGSLEFDATVLAALLGSSMLCAFIVLVVCVMIATRRRTRTRRHRQLNHGKNPSRYKLVDVWNGTHDEEPTEKRRTVNDDNNDDDRCAAAVPRTVIRTLDRSPRSSRGAAVSTRHSRGSVPTLQANSAATLNRNKPDRCINVNHFDVEPPHAACSNV